MKNIYSPMNQAKEIMDELGVSAYTSAGEARDFNQVVNELNDALSTKTTQERASLEDAIFGIQGKDAFDKMVSTSAEKTQYFYDSLKYTDDGSMGSAALQAETMLDNLEGRITLFQSASEGFTNAIYKHLQNPLKELVEIGTDYVSELTESIESGDFSGLAESLGSVLADAVTTLSGYIPQIVDIGASLIQSLVSRISDNAPQILESLIPALKSLISGILIISEDLIQLGGELILTLISGIAQALPDIADTAISLIFTFIDTRSELIPELIPIASEIIQTLADSLMENIPEFIVDFENLIWEINKVLSSPDFLMTILNAGISIIKSLAEGLISAIPVIVEGWSVLIKNVVNFIMEAVPTLINAGAEIITALISGITENADSVGNTAVEIIAFLINSLSENLPLIIDSALGLIDSLLTGIIVNLPVLLSAGIEIITSLISCISENVPLLLDAAVEIIMSLLDFIIQNLPALTEAAIEIMMQILSGITANLPKIAESAVKLVQSLISGIISALPQIIDAVFQLVETIWNTITETDWLALGVEILTGIINGIAESLAVIYIAVEDFLTEISDFFDECFLIGKSEISGFFSDIWTSVKEFFTNIVVSAKNGASEFIGNITEFFSQLPYKVGFWIGETLGNIVQWAVEMRENAQNTASEFVENISNFLSELPEKVKNWLTSAIDEVVEWRSELIEKGKNAASEFLENTVDFIKKLPSKAKEHIDTTIENVKHEQSMDSSGKLCIKASAEGFLGYLCDSIQLYRHYENTTAVDFLTALLEVHNSQVSAEKRLYLGICNIANADYTRSKTTSYRTTLEEIRVNLIERIGGEIQVRKVGDKLYIDYLERIGMESSTAVELAENMKSLDVKTDSANIITRLIPLGTQINDETAERLTIESVNDGKPYIDDENAVEKYGIIVGTAEFDDITLPENLLERAEKYLENNNRILKSYEAQILDLSVLYSSHQSIECGNTYTFKNAFFGLDEPLRIMKKTTDIYKPYSPVVQIGDKTESITDIAVNQAKLIEYKLLEQKIDILTSAKATASNLIKSGFNGYVVANENEICIMDTKDKNTAQKVWRWNENGFGFSNTGYNGTYGTAMTMDGKIVADFITAGILRGIEISNGDGTFHVSPDGTVSASAMNITGGTINIHAENGINDVISLNHGNNHLHITPNFFRIITPDRNTIQMDGSIIHGYSYFWEGEFTQTDDFTNCRMQVIIREAPAVALICKECELSDGEFNILITSADTAKLSEGTYIIHFRLIDGSGFSYRKLVRNLYVYQAAQGGD